jgi:hypothetical protein
MRTSSRRILQARRLPRDSSAWSVVVCWAIFSLFIGGVFWGLDLVWFIQAQPLSNDSPSTLAAEEGNA